MLLPSGCSGIPEGCRRRRSRRLRRSPLHGPFPNLLRCNDGSSSGRRVIIDHYSDEPACAHSEVVSEISSLNHKEIWNGKGKGVVFDTVEISEDEVKPLDEVASYAMCNHTIWKLGQLSGERSNSHASFGPRRSISAEIAERNSQPAQALQVDASMFSSSDEVKQSNLQDSCHDCINKLKVRKRRKLNVHINELSSPEKSKGSSRRIKIMRCLGLIAPVGSPFERLPQ